MEERKMESSKEELEKELGKLIREIGEAFSESAHKYYEEHPERRKKLNVKFKVIKPDEKD